MTNDNACERAVADAISAILEGTEDDVTAAFTRLGELQAVDVVAELFLWVEDLTEGVDLDSLIAAARIPLPEGTREIVESVLSRDMKALGEVTSTHDLGAAVQAILTVVVSLKDARTRL